MTARGVVALLALLGGAAPGAARAQGGCAGALARWGDVNADSTVSIIDAQQVARHSVGLGVANAAALAARGDVNADSVVSILDAQQIARFSVGLGAAARINTPLTPAPPVATLTLAPGTAQLLAVGGTLALVATPRDAAAADLTGCVTVAWSSSAQGVATVSAAGVVTGVAPGTASITATSGAATASVAVTVGGVPGTTGVLVTATSPVPTSRFFVRIDSGGMATEVVRRVPATSRTLSQLIALPAGSGYRVRVYAVDSGSTTPDTEPLVGGLGVQGRVAVTTGTTTPVPVALVAPTAVITAPDSTSVAEPVAVRVAVRYPARAFPGEYNPVACTLRWGPAPVTDASAPSETQFASQPLADSTAECQPYLPAQGVPATLHYQAQFQLAPFTPEGHAPVHPRLVFPSTQRGEPLRRLQVRTLTTGAVVTFTAPTPSRRVYVVARRGGGVTYPPQQVVVWQDGRGMRTGSLTVPLLPGADHDLRVVSLDSASWANDSAGSWGWVVGGAARVTGVTVPATGTAALSVTLEPPQVTVALPDSVGVGEPMAGTFTVTDPADLFNGLAEGNLASWMGDTPWTINGIGTLVWGGSASRSTTPGTRTWDLALPARAVAGEVHVQSRVAALVASPFGGRPAYLAVYDRDLARQQPLRTIRVGVPAGGTCVTTPLALGDSVGGMLSNTDCRHPVLDRREDRYALTLTARTAVELRLRSSAFDPLVEVRTPDTRLVAANDDDSLSTNALLPVTLDPGAYVVSVRSDRPNPLGAYTLSVRRAPARATLTYTTADGASIATLAPGARVATTVAVRDTTGAPIAPAVTYTVRDDSVALVTAGGIEARSRSGATPGTFVVARAPSLAPVAAESIWVLVPRGATGPVLRTDLTSFRLPTEHGAAVTFAVLVDLRGAAQLGATDFDLLYPTSLFFAGDAGALAPVVTAAPGVIVRGGAIGAEVGRISFSYARPGNAGSANDGVVPMATVTLRTRGAGAWHPDGRLTFLPGSMVSATLADLLPQLTTFDYPLVLRIP